MVRKDIYVVAIIVIFIQFYSSAIDCDSSKILGVNDAILKHSTHLTAVKSALWGGLLPGWGIPISYWVANGSTPIPKQPPQDTTINFKCYIYSYSDKANKMNRKVALRNSIIATSIIGAFGIMFGILSSGQGQH